MSDEYDPDNTEYTYAEIISWLNKRLTSLELAIKNSPPNSHLKELLHTVNNKLGEYTLKHNSLEKKPCMQITEIFTPSEVRIFRGNIKRITEIEKQIAELKENIKNINKILTVVTEGRVLELKAHENLEELLRLFIKEVGNYLDTDRFEYLLEKLDSKPKKECDHKWIFHLRGLEKCEKCGKFQTTEKTEKKEIGEKKCSFCGELYKNHNITQHGNFICKKKPEPEKKPVIEPSLDLWEKNTISVVCPFCYKGYYLAPKSIEERVRDATRKELIEEFLNDFTWYMAFDLHYKWFQWRRCVCKVTPFQFRDWMLEKWQGRVK